MMHKPLDGCCTLLDMHACKPLTFYLNLVTNNDRLIDTHPIILGRYNNCALYVSNCIIVYTPACYMVIGQPAIIHGAYN
jgi:hypothetical protein